METINSIYFYGHRSGTKFKEFSNFYYSEFYDPKSDITFICNEQYFMYYKCLLFDNLNETLIQNILESTNPAEIKKFGRNVKNYDEQIWSQKRYKIMKKGLLLKFKNPELKNILLSTGNKNIYEASPYDKIWGIGYSVKDAPNTLKSLFGQNLLGKCLMDVRNTITG